MFKWLSQSLRKCRSRSQEFERGVRNITGQKYVCGFNLEEKEERDLMFDKNLDFLALFETKLNGRGDKYFKADQFMSGVGEIAREGIAVLLEEVVTS